ncbi:DUF1697 domain-containing protein [Saxibacter everestensis]|uniref:DUF1697 domain-containing protein n=1 Tax=Saxibacter everestensis TaxID=2909229 RepID=A0ABY8QPR6_9MICO|nr:DUF1697 domain-containing protein [Brevibacteriaceae bacterium ZFBP1038]
MVEFVALLRGVNVGGVNLKMADVRDAFTEGGFDDVRTVLASGNVLFRCQSGELNDISRRCEEVLREAFRYQARVIVVPKATLAAAVAQYPFDTNEDERHPYLIFGSDPDALAELVALGLDVDVERVAESQSDLPVVYWEVLRGQSVDSGLAKAAAKSSARVNTTTRNLRTCKKILLK